MRRGRRFRRRRINSFDPHEPFERRYWWLAIGLIAGALVVYVALDLAGVAALGRSRAAPRQRTEPQAAAAPVADPRSRPRDLPLDDRPAQVEADAAPVRDDPRSKPRDEPRQDAARPARSAAR